MLSLSLLIHPSFTFTPLASRPSALSNYIRIPLLVSIYIHAGIILKEFYLKDPIHTRIYIYAAAAAPRAKQDAFTAASRARIQRMEIIIHPIAVYTTHTHTNFGIYYTCALLIYIRAFLFFFYEKFSMYKGQ